jgi:hypothetical protein
VGFPKTSGSRGIHVNVRIHPRWTFTEVRRAALALSREIERRAPALASSKWWKEERHGVFLDYNQNAKDRTTAAAYSVRPLPDARVSAPLTWSEIPQCNPADFTVTSMPGRFAAVGDPHAGMDAAAGALDGLLELAARDGASGLADAPWPPHFAKGIDEAPRVAPSRARRASAAAEAAPTEEGTGTASEPGRARAPARTRAGRATPGLVVVAQSPSRVEALAGLERWKARHPTVAACLAIDDVLVDNMRGRSSTWTRIRVNLRHVPGAEWPVAEPPDPDDDPTRLWRQRRKAGKEPGPQGGDGDGSSGTP